MAAAPGEVDVRSAGDGEGGFGDQLARRVNERASQLVLGLDPDPMRLWPRALELPAEESSRPPGDPIDQAAGTDALAPAGAAQAGAATGAHAGTPAGVLPVARRAAHAVAAHCRLVIEAAGDQCVAVKPQVACFERLGAPGWAALVEVMACAAEHGLLVICDAKRGDIDVTAEAYAQAFFGPAPTPFGELPGLGADALTVNPLLGRDAVAPLLSAARRRGAGLFILVRTSNPSAADLQDRELASGGTVSDRLAALVDELGAPGVGSSGLSDVGAVAGATVPARLATLREAMPHAPILLPGVGAQGGKVQDLAAAFAPGPAGGLVSASRGIVNAHLQSGGDPAAAARAEAQRLRELAWSLAN